VDNRPYKRVLYEVLDHDATHTDIEAFLGRLQTALDARGLALKGITTDGSALYLSRSASFLARSRISFVPSI